MRSSDFVFDSCWSQRRSQIELKKRLLGVKQDSNTVKNLRKSETGILLGSRPWKDFEVFNTNTRIDVDLRHDGVPASITVYLDLTSSHSPQGMTFEVLKTPKDCTGRNFSWPGLGMLTTPKM